MLDRIKGREPEILALFLWTALLINDTLVFPLDVLAHGLAVLSLGWFTGLCIALMLAAVLKRLFHLRRRTATLGVVGAVIGAAALQSVLDLLVNTTIAPLLFPDGIGVPGFAISRDIEQISVHLRLVLSWNLVVFGFYATTVTLLHAQRRMLEAQMRALRYQLNPHFLFNTLNSVAGLIEEGATKRAENMVLSLSSFLRTTLSFDPMHEVMLADEMALQRAYLEIERERFLDRIRLEIDLPDDISTALVPSLILQPLVENAVKHGVGTVPGAVGVYIRASRKGGRLMLAVENDIATENTTGKPGTGTGLRNVEDRLRARFQHDGRFTHGPIAGGRYRAMIDLPYRTA